MSDEVIHSSGIVSLDIEYADGRKEHREVKNKILRQGRINLVLALANQFNSTSFDFFITGISFGSGGTVGGTPRYVDDTRDGLFGPTVITKPIIATVNPDFPTQVTFTSVIAFDEAVGSIINEMALQMASGDYFSMTTFGDITKTSAMQMVYNWRISMI